MLCPSDLVRLPATYAIVAGMLTMPDGTKVDLSPSDMQSWEIIGSYRYARSLANYHPTHKLAQQLADWLYIAQKELERRGEWWPEALPPQCP